MSHCTSFNMTFNDKRLLFRAMRNLGFNPENIVWAEYQGLFAKKLSVGGNIIGKLLTGIKNNINLFFIETEQGFVPHFESDRLSPRELESQGEGLLQELRLEYLRCVVQTLVESIQDSGNVVDISEEVDMSNTSFVVTIGATDKVLRISIDNKGNIEEKVEGVLGRSCVDLTENIESKLTASNLVERSWTHEYDAVVEDKQIQILRLS